MSDQLKPCPVDKIESGLDDETFADQVWSACQSCPNRAPSQAEAEMREVLTGLLPLLRAGNYRGSTARVEAILAKYPKGGAVKCNHAFTGRDMLCKKCGMYFPETNNQEGDAHE